jgi:hypothetical protein
VPPASFKFPYFLLSMFLQHLSWGSVDVPALRVEVTRAWEAATAVDAARVVWYFLWRLLLRRLLWHGIALQHGSRMQRNEPP